MHRRTRTASGLDRCGRVPKEELTQGKPLVLVQSMGIHTVRTKARGEDPSEMGKKVQKVESDQVERPIHSANYAALRQVLWP